MISLIGTTWQSSSVPPNFEDVRNSHAPDSTAITAMLTVTVIGRDQNENKRLAEMAERHSQRQAEQNRHTVELQREVAAGTRQLMEADAKARKEMVTLQREVQADGRTVA